jgi:thymidylate synthase (FAD)
MPRLIPDNEGSADFAIAEAARCSYKRGTKTISDDKVLIRYLMRHDHTSPFEMVKFKFHMKLPFFCARQMIRHRMVNVNELSGRYSELPEEYYIPEMGDVRFQSEINKQGSEFMDDENLSNIFRMALTHDSQEAHRIYKVFLKDNVAREQCRMFLTLNYYTEWYWCIDLHNLLHFLDLRTDSKAQKEIRVYADAILKLITPIVPYTIEAWEDYSAYREGLKLTQFEVNAIRGYIKEQENKSFVPLDSESKFECREWEEKAKRLGFEKHSE